MVRKIASYLARHHLALLALFVALGSTSYAAADKLLPANSVGSKQVRNHSLRQVDLRPGVIRSLRSRITYVEGPQALVCAPLLPPNSCPSPASSFNFSDATCPPGSIAIAGGWKTDNILEASTEDSGTVFDSGPVGSNQVWRVFIGNFSSTPLRFHTVAVCAH